MTSTGDQLQQAYAACSIIEQFEICLNHLDSILRSVTDRNLKTELEALRARLKSSLEVLDSDVTFLPIIHEGVSLIKYRSTVERLGLGGEIVRLRRDHHMTYEQIATRLGLNVNTVQSFIRQYERLTPLQKAKVQRRSIFDTTERMEELAAMIYRQLARLEGANDELAVRYTAELRSTIELAAKLTKEIANYQKFQQLVQVVTEILMEELPKDRQRILQRITRATGGLGIQPSLIGAEEPHYFATDSDAREWGLSGLDPL